MKSLGIDQIVNFPFPTPPSRYGLRQAERLLSYLGAIDTTSRNLKLTEIGKIMAKFPVSPRFSKMILIAAQQTKNETILQYVIAIVAGLAVGDPFIRDDIIDAPRHEWEDEQEDSASGTKDGKIKKNDTSSSQEHEEKLKKRAAYYRVMQVKTEILTPTDFF